jgi:hypothetical protein
MLLLIAPVTTGEPVTTVVLTVLSAIGSLFGMFGRGVSKEVKSALETLRGSIHQVSETLMRFGWRIARAFGWLLKAMHTAWVRVIRPMLSQLRRVMGRLRRLIERDLPRLLKIIDKIRARVLELYEKWMRPVLLVIQRMRRMILILRLLHIHWGDKLDAKLAQVQEKVMYPLRVVLEHIAVVEGWINAIVTAEQLIQETIFHNALFHYQDPLMRGWYAGMSRPGGKAALMLAEAQQSDVPAWKSQADMQQALKTGGGPLAEDARKAAEEFRRLLGGGG